MSLFLEWLTRIENIHDQAEVIGLPPEVKARFGVVVGGAGGPARGRKNLPFQCPGRAGRGFPEGIERRERRIGRKVG